MSRFYERSGDAPKYWQTRCLATILNALTWPIRKQRWYFCWIFDGKLARFVIKRIVRSA